METCTQQNSLHFVTFVFHPFAVSVFVANFELLNFDIRRSVINVLQEKQYAHERDMSILKDDLEQLRRELAAEREIVRELRAQTADSVWAIADVKRGQDQVCTIKHQGKLHPACLDKVVF